MRALWRVRVGAKAVARDPSLRRHGPATVRPSSQDESSPVER